MTLPRNRILALLLCLVLGFSALGSVSTARADERADSITQAADYIATSWQEKPFSSAGTLTDAILALSAANQHADAVEAMLVKLHEVAADYVGTPEEDPNPAGLAKVITTLIATNQDPHHFLGTERDLVEELKGYAQKDDASVKNFWAPYHIAIALSRAGEQVPQAIIDTILANQQNGAFGYTAGGKFNADPDYTGIGIMAMNALTGNKKVAAKTRLAASNSIDAAVAWAQDPANQQTDANGHYYWATYSSANSTGILAGALGSVGEDIESPVAYLVDQQKKTGVGAWSNAHDGTKADLMATTQAIFAPAGVGYDTVQNTEVKQIDFNASDPGTNPEPNPSYYVGACKAGEGVTVVVDYQGLGGDPQIRCAVGEQENGLEALHNAGFPSDGTVQNGDSFICRINGRPAPSEALALPNDPDYVEDCEATPPAAAYWSYFQSKDEGKTWSYATTGALASHPKLGDWEGWSFSFLPEGATSGEPRSELAISGLDPSDNSTDPAEDPKDQTKEPSITPTKPGTPGAPKPGLPKTGA